MHLFFLYTLLISTVWASLIQNIPAGSLQNVLSGLKTSPLILLITTSAPEYQCSLCDQFDPIFFEMAEIVNSNLQDPPIFLRLEAIEHKEELTALGVKTVPLILGFPSSKDVYTSAYFELTQLLKEDPINKDKIENIIGHPFNQIGMEHYRFELVAREPLNEMIYRLGGFISKTIGENINLDKIISNGKASFDYSIMIQCFLFVFVGIKLYKKFGSGNEGEDDLERQPFLANWKIYCYLSVVIIVISISGLHYCMQRGVPFISQNQGKIMWFAPTSRNQMGFETIVSVVLQLLWGISLFMLICGANMFSEVDGSRAFIRFLSLGVVIACWCCGVGVYGVKDGGYPYSIQKILKW